MRMRVVRGAPEPAAVRVDDVAATVRALAVLLEAGVTPRDAWRYVADGGDAHAASVVHALDTDAPVAQAIGGVDRAWQPVGAAWQVAATVGAPLAPSLRAIAAAGSDAAAAQDDVRIALAEPAATARLVAWLPLVAVALGMLMGFDVVQTLAQPLGAAALVAGVALMFVAQRWTRALVRRAQPDGAVPGAAAELWAIALSGGVSIDRAEAVLRHAGGSEADAEIDRILSLSARAGAPAVELLRAHAAAARHAARTDGRLRAAALSSRLLLPLGVCTLPAFLLLGVAPMLLSVLGSTPGLPT